MNSLSSFCCKDLINAAGREEKSCVVDVHTRVEVERLATGGICHPGGKASCKDPPELGGAFFFGVPLPFPKYRSYPIVLPSTGDERKAATTSNAAMITATILAMLDCS